MTRIAFCALSISIVVCGCSSGPATDYTATGVSFMQQVTAASTQGEGAPAPEFSWLDASGRPVSFKEHTKGKPVLLNFWATWCMPCRVELPELKKINEEYGPRGVAVIGVVTQDWKDPATLTLDYVNKFVADWKLSYPIVIEGKKRDEKPLWQAYGLNSGLPVSVLVDKQGRIVKTMLGSHTEEQFAAEIDKLL